MSCPKAYGLGTRRFQAIGVLVAPAHQFGTWLEDIVGRLPGSRGMPLQPQARLSTMGSLWGLPWAVVRGTCHLQSTFCLLLTVVWAPGKGTPGHSLRGVSADAPVPCPGRELLKNHGSLSEPARVPGQPLALSAAGGALQPPAATPMANLGCCPWASLCMDPRCPDCGCSEAGWVMATGAPPPLRAGGLTEILPRPPDARQSPPRSWQLSEQKHKGVAARPSREGREAPGGLAQCPTAAVTQEAPLCLGRLVPALATWAPCESRGHSVNPQSPLLRVPGSS